MKTHHTLITLIGALVVLFSANEASATKVNSEPARQTYVYCNVYVGSACFGVAPGDEMQMRIPADFVRYEVTLGSKASATIYVGSHPQIQAKTLADKFEQCTKGAKPCSFGGVYGSSIEAIYSEKREGDYVHVRINGVKESNRRAAVEFIQNIRPCKRVGLTLLCKEKSVFNVR